MISHLSSKTSPRKLRLFAVGCCYHLWGLLDERSQHAVLVAERFAEGEATLEELEIAWAAARDAREDAAELETRDAADAVVAASDPEEDLSALASDCAIYAGGRPIRDAQGLLLQELFDNILLSITPDPSWLAWNNAAVAKLAEAIYTDRAFDRLPILADALEDAGCTDPDILAHCRGPGPHVRGCWVVDLLTGRK